MEIEIVKTASGQAAEIAILEHLALHVGAMIERIIQISDNAPAAAVELDRATAMFLAEDGELRLGDEDGFFNLSDGAEELFFCSTKIWADEFGETLQGIIGTDTTRSLYIGGGHVFGPLVVLVN